MESFAELQTRLTEVCSVYRPGSRTPHVVVALPSFSIGESLLSHYADRLPPLEHRYLVSLLMLHRIPGCELVFVCSTEPGADVLDYYLSLVPPAHRDSVRRRHRLLVLGEATHRPVAAKLLERPDLLDALRESFRGRPAVIEPWNVTAHEVEVARLLGAPVNGTVPDLWPLGFKGSGRRLLREAGVPVPAGTEDVRTVTDVLVATRRLLGARPDTPGVVVKLDDSGAGDGNVVVRFERDRDGARAEDAVRALPPWFVRELRLGGVVEELVEGTRFTSPSVQVDISPDGSVDVLATHEQVLGGASGQVYLGCYFPADPPYAAELGRHGQAVGEVLAARGARGRLSLDFAATADRQGRWQVYGLEINLRKGGTTHPYTALRNLVPGRYDRHLGRYLASDRTPRCYCATDNLVDPSWTGLQPRRVISAVQAAGLAFDPARGTGVVLHMLSGLAVDGRFGLTAIGRTRQESIASFEAVREVVETLCADHRALT